MTGNDLFDWLGELWYDLLHFSQADVFSLAWRLVLVFFVSYVLLRILGDLLRGFWRRITPFRWFITGIPRKIKRRRQQKQRCLESKTQERIAQIEQEQQAEKIEADKQKAAKEREAILRALSLDD